MSDQRNSDQEKEYEFKLFAIIGGVLKIPFHSYQATKEWIRNLWGPVTTPPDFEIRQEKVKKSKK